MITLIILMWTARELRKRAERRAREAPRSEMI